MTVSSARPLCFQDMVLALHEYWRDQNCVLLQSYDAPVGAGTFHPETALRALGAAAWRGAYIQPCRRPTDGRYGDNPNRLQHYYQYQVFLKPSPENSQSLYLESLAALGVNAAEHDIRFIEDDWESPTLGASGLGWEVWCDGMEVSQFTYFQQMGGIDCHPSGTEITYGLERLAMYVQEVEDVYALRYNDSVSYGDLFREAERQYSHFHFEHADTGQFWRSFETAVSETGRLLAQGLVRPAWDSCLSASHDFNCLDARGAISASERQRLIARIRNAARSCCEAWLDREQAGKNSQS